MAKAPYQKKKNIKKSRLTQKTCSVFYYRKFPPALSFSSTTMHPNNFHSPHPQHSPHLSSNPFASSSWSPVPGAHLQHPPKPKHKLYRLLFNWSPDRIASIPSGSDVKVEHEHEHVVKQEPSQHDSPLLTHKALKHEHDGDPFAYDYEPFQFDTLNDEPYEYFPFEDYFDPVPVSAVSPSGSAFADYGPLWSDGDFGASSPPIPSGSGYDPHVAYASTSAAAPATVASWPHPSASSARIGAHIPPASVPNVNPLQYHTNAAPNPFAPVQRPPPPPTLQIPPVASSSSSLAAAAALSLSYGPPAPRPVEQNAIVQRLVECAPRIDTLPDPYDDNGDFYGRGRDLWIGPQAKADEYVLFFSCMLFE
jgi:hypothetical protein